MGHPPGVADRALAAVAACYGTSEPLLPAICSRRPRMFCGRRFLGAIALLFTLDCRAPAARLAAPAEWSAPVDLPGMPSNRLQRWPVITAVRDTLYVAANVFPIEGSAVGPQPLYLARLPGGVIPNPPGDFQFVYPKIAAAPNGSVHLVWAEFESTQPDESTWDMAPITTLWHSVFSGGRWSVPRQAFAASGLQWPWNAGNIAVDAAGRLHVAVWAWRDSVAGMMHLVGSAAGWQAYRTPYRSRQQAAVATLGDSVLLAVVEPSFDTADTTGVTIAVSPGRDAAWTTTAVLRTFRERQASSLHFVRSDTSLFLAWAESPPRQFSRDTLRIVRVDDRVRATPVLDLALPPGASTAAVVAGCGNLAFIVETLSLRPRLYIGGINDMGQASLDLLRPAGELAALGGIGATTRSVAVVAAIQTEPDTPARAVLITRSACAPWLMNSK